MQSNNPVDLAFNRTLLAAALTVFYTGAVLFISFHIGSGPYRDSAAGISRLVWLNVHRLSAVVFFTAVAVHLLCHSMPFKNIMQSARAAMRSGRWPEVNAIYYFSFFLCSACSIVTWFLWPGSVPLAGPVPLEPLPAWRHIWVNIHNYSGIAALMLSLHHVVSRWGGVAVSPQSGAVSPKHPLPWLSRRSSVKS